MIEKDLFSTLKNVCDRVYPIKMPEGTTYPAITYQVIYDGANQSIKGNVFQRDVRIQVDIWAKSYAEVKTLKDEVVDKVVELNGNSINAMDIYEDDIEVYRELIDFKVRR